MFIEKKVMQNNLLIRRVNINLNCINVFLHKRDLLVYFSFVVESRAYACQ